MSLKKLAIVPFLFFAFFLAGCAFQNQDTQNQNAQINQDDSSIIFFYGEECPHCQAVEEYFSKNNVSEKVEFSQREVYHEKGNAALMAEKAKVCGIGEDELGVPMLWNEGRCLFGDVDIINFFNEKLNEE